MVTNEVTSEVTSENRIFRTCTPIKRECLLHVVIQDRYSLKTA